MAKPLMVRDVLPSDVDFARGMIHSSHSDAEILALLASRGIDADRATRLVDDLRHGRKPDSQVPFLRDGVVPSVVRKEPAATAPPTPAPTPMRTRPVRRIHRRSPSAWWFLLLLIIFAWAFGYTMLHLGSDATQDSIQKDKHQIPPAPNKQ